MNVLRGSIFLVGTMLVGCAHGDGASHGAKSAAPAAGKTGPEATTESIVAKSDAFARRLVDVEAQFEPEAIVDLGDPRVDVRAMDLGPDRDARALRAYTDAETAYQSAIAAEPPSPLRDELTILARAAHDKAREIALASKYEVPFYELARVIYEGLWPLLRAEASPERKRSARARLEAYTAVSAEGLSLAESAQRRIRERMDRPGLVFPFKPHVTQYLEGSGAMLGGLREAFAKSGITGYEPAFARLETQLRAYDEFVRTVILPRARDSFRRPEEVYAFTLERVGIDARPRDLAAQARRAFAEIQRAMDAAASEVARAKGYSATDYRSVIRALKRDRIAGETLVATYHRRIEELEGILRKEHLVTLPNRPLRFRIASAADSARIPAPYYQNASPIFHATAPGEFVLPGQSSQGTSGPAKDFDFDAATWWLTAHEGRPGHDLQMTHMSEKALSIARGLLGFNSANVEGWGLYAESMVEPYLPPEARLICLQARLMRAAHAFLDIELNLGLIDEAEVLRVMTDDVVFSENWAKLSVRRYTEWLPGQAPSYFYGYTQLTELRAETQRKLGASFDAQKFHDCILDQGFVRLPVLRRAVLDSGCAKRG